MEVKYICSHNIPIITIKHKRNHVVPTNHVELVCGDSVRFIVKKELLLVE